VCLCSTALKRGVCAPVTLCGGCCWWAGIHRPAAAAACQSFFYVLRLLQKVNGAQCQRLSLAVLLAWLEPSYHEEKCRVEKKGAGRPRGCGVGRGLARRSRICGGALSPKPPPLAIAHGALLRRRSVGPRCGAAAVTGVSSTAHRLVRRQGQAKAKAKAQQARGTHGARASPNTTASFSPLRACYSRPSTGMYTPPPSSLSRPPPPPPPSLELELRWKPDPYLIT
jgi:hypothetical protein